MTSSGSDGSTGRESERSHFSWLVAGFGVIALVGVGVAIGMWLRPSSKSAGAPPIRGDGGVIAGAVDRRPMTIDVSRARPAPCAKPIAPGKGHPGRVLAMTLPVSDEAGHSYLLGWQIVSYSGPRTYTLDQKGGALLALEPANSGAPLGFGSGKLVIGSDEHGGSIDATVHLSAGGATRVVGRWTCTPGPG